MKSIRILVLFALITIGFNFMLKEADAKTIHTGEVLRLTAAETKEEVIWSSEDETVATVDEEGKVRGVAKGETKIIAEVGEECYRWRVTVRKKGLNLIRNTVEKGDRFLLEVNGIEEKVVWESANPKIAKVSKKGMVSAVKPGVVRILGRTDGRVYSCRVVVVKRDNDVVYLTFDDGPSSDVTPKVLNILKRKNIKATFFVIGYKAEHEKLVKRIVEEGHTLAIHGYSHVYRDIYRSENAFMDNVTKLRKKLKKVTGEDCNIMRFPGGSSNMSSRFNPGIMTKLTKRVLNEGYHYFDWNVSSGDASKYKSRQSVYRNVKKGLRKNRENVVLLHDFKGNKATLSALEDVIDYALKKGYVFKRITEDTKQIHHNVAN